MQFNKYIKRKILKKKFKKILNTSRTMGTDGITTNKFKTILNDEINIIKRKVKNKTYNVSPYKEKLIIKNRDANPRMISIPTNRDKLLFATLNDYLKDTFKDKIVNNQIDKIIKQIKNSLKNDNYDCFIKFDIINFYPSIDHSILLKKVTKEVKSMNVLYILNKALEQVTVSNKKRLDRDKINEKGLPQGLSISNILSSIYMINFDKKYYNKSDILYFRFMDDMVILCKNENIDEIKKSILKDIKKLKLEAHDFKDGSDKSTIGNLDEDKFQFLGFEIKKDVISVRDSSVDKIKERIINLFNQNKDVNNLKFLEMLNLKISGCIYNNQHRGWIHFFRHIDNLALLYELDSFIKNCFKRYSREYNNEKVKSFVKTYFKLKNLDMDKLDATTYIPKYSSKINLELKREIDSLRHDINLY